MKTIVFHCKTITPMFCYGADQNTPEIRAASVKGALRFWWRAINGHLPVDELREKERAIFGGAGKGGAQRSQVIVRVCDTLRIDRFNENKWKEKFYEKKYNLSQGTNLFNYLGYGALINWNKHKKRNVLEKDGLFSEDKYFKINISYSPKYEKDLVLAIQALHYLGSFGAKGRNGFGKISLYSETLPDLFSKDLETFVLNLINQNKKLAEYTTISSKSTLFRTKNIYLSWKDALFEIGCLYRNARLSIEKSNDYDLRQHIAAPIIVAKVIKSELSRHSKQYFLIVNMCKKEKKYRGYILHMPYSYILEKECSKYQEAYQKLNQYLLNESSLEVVNEQ